MTDERARLIFFWRSGSWWVVHAWVDRPTSSHTWSALTESSRLLTIVTMGKKTISSWEEDMLIGT